MIARKMMEELEVKFKLNRRAKAKANSLDLRSKIGSFRGPSMKAFGMSPPFRDLPRQRSYE
jgi:hypothetical protein